MSLEHSGFQIILGVIAPETCEQLVGHAVALSGHGAGTRDLLPLGWCQDIARQLKNEPRIAGLLPAEGVAVQCTYFDKSSETSNWLVAWHQDLSIPVKERVPSPLCSGWSRKQGVDFVQPPVNVLSSLVAVRVHLDDSTADNGPLRVLSGSHRLGQIVPSAVEQHRLMLDEIVCIAPRGSALAIKPLLLHASSKSKGPLPRRVLHFLFGPPDLPEGLAWHTAV